MFKMDIEEGEKTVLEEIDMEYVKQFALEVHLKLRQDVRKLLTKLEICFYLYHRDTRFFMHDGLGATGHLTEFQAKNQTRIELATFQDEVEMAEFMFSMGKLYFINSNFLDSK
jgi:hypothetical protein